MNNIPFSRRLSLFLLGVLLGLPIMWYLISKKNAIRLPGDIIHEQLASRKLTLTKHAQCRMDCRNISEAEIIDIMNNGSINYSKSEVRAIPCKKYAIEGKTQDGQNVRIIYGLCDMETKVITAIDLDKEYTCDCK